MKSPGQAVYAVWDVETTGLNPAVDGVVEVGLAMVARGEVILRASLLVDPGMPISPEAQAVHGISDLDVAGAPSLQEALETLGQLMPVAPDFYVAHGAAFDSAFLRLNQRPWICTLNLSRQLYPGRTHRLMPLCRELGLQVGEAHRAEGDAVAAARLLAEMISALPELVAAEDLLAVGGAA
nr:3'-5' exonuclease [uncultured Holophaga sp.]